jgi:nucleotide-binding universal stress UspA family protein
MKQLRRVLVGTDFTSGAVRAARRALCLPLARAATVELIHAAPPIAPRAFEAGVKQAALAALDRQAAGLTRGDAASGLRIRKALASGSPAEALAREARVRRSDLVVIGPRGGRGLPDLDLGSTAERLLAESSVPVLIARRGPGRPYRHALVAIDLAGSSDGALALAMRLVAGSAGRITLLHAIDLPLEGGIRLAGTSAEESRRLRERSRDEAGRLLATRTRWLKRRGFAADWALANGDARSVILEAARRLRADLVALGTRRARDRTGFLIGSVARWVARRATCDVLVARMPAD